MVLKNIKYAIRGLWRDKFYTILNGLGLAVGIAISLLIFLWVADEFSFDNFHTKGDRIYRVNSTSKFAGKESTNDQSPFPLVAATQAAIAEVEEMAWVTEYWDPILKYSDQRFAPQNVYLANDAFFKVFDFSFISGNANSAFSKPENIVLTEKLALQIFGTVDIIGQPIQLAGVGELVVSAVLENTPTNSHLQFSCLLPYVKGSKQYEDFLNPYWGSLGNKIYVLLRPNVDAEIIGEKLSQLAKDNGNTELSFGLQALKDIHLRSEFLAYNDGSYGNLGTIKLMSMIGILILLIACINYVNLSTARFSHRSKSTGVRKIIGASRWTIFTQYFSEAFVLVFFAALLGSAIANAGLPYFEQLCGKAFTSSQLFNTTSLSILFLTTLVALFLSGIYPAIQLSVFKPLDAIRNTSAAMNPKQSYLRRFLVVGQFVCSGALIISTLVMLSQMNYLKEKKLGYEREHIFSFRCTDADPLVIKEELKNNLGVEQITTSSNSIVHLGARYSGFDYEGKSPEAKPYIVPLNVEDELPNFFGLELKEGRWFKEGNADSLSFLLNETAVAKLEIEEPIGKWMNYRGYKGSIIGVVKDFHFKSLHDEIEQMIFLQNPKKMRTVYVKTTGEQASAAIASAKQVFQKHESDAVFDYQFLDQKYDNLYKTESRSNQLLALFAFIAILISCLGVFGLVTYSAERRQKEIGIRKVLGASITGLVTMLSKDFIKLVLIALLIASPIAWYFMEDWLNDFAYRIDMPWGMFVLAGVLAIALALITVCFQSVRAALNNPVESLRSE